MKKIYESWDELSQDACYGSSTFHVLSGHSPDECMGWQKGIKEFCKHLDSMEIAVPENLWEKFWDVGE